MKFEEKNAIELPVYPDVLIYFLLMGDEVVYVGQTINGIIRPLSHKGKKNFDGIRILPCDATDIDDMEGYYIDKYRPKYNTLPNLKLNKSIRRAKSEIKDLFGINGYTIRHFRKDMKMLGIEPKIYSGVEYISYEDECRISWLHRHGTLEPEE